MSRMGKGSTILVSGEKLAKLRSRLIMTQRELGSAIGISEARVRQAESKAATGLYPKTFRELARVAGVTADQLREQIGAVGQWDQNVEPYSESEVPTIPTFDLEVAAGGWVDVSGIGEVCDPRQIDDGRFRVRVRGDSMTPKYGNGKTVEFKCLRADRDIIEIGRDYYVQRSDGMATFKRILSMDEDQIVLVALNRKKYPEPMPVPRGLVVRMAKAVFVGDPVE
jgi:phage repressor protein C with HTH and peptisase S24 domain